MNTRYELAAVAADTTQSMERTVALRSNTGEIARVRIARSFGSRFIGLLNRSHLNADEGLLFDSGGSIHSLGMRFAIDVVFLDHDLKIVRIAAKVKPWRFVFAPRRTRFVLELAAGAATSAGFACGMTLHTCRQEETVATHH
jgi:uncharacterized membrane protein (UPF0127 family)